VVIFSPRVTAFSGHSGDGNILHDWEETKVDVDEKGL